MTEYQIPEPVLFNPLKHHLGFMREFISFYTEYQSSNDLKILIKELKHLGTSVMDVYSGSLNVQNITNEVIEFLSPKGFLIKESYSQWTGIKMNDLKIISLSDASQWILKFHDNKIRFVHIFPARNSQHTFRIKSNTLKSSLLYLILIGKDFITGDDLNKVRMMTGLSPVKDPAESEAITEMISLLRG